MSHRFCPAWIMNQYDAALAKPKDSYAQAFEKSPQVKIANLKKALSNLQVFK
jgi:hypothetical protein